ncbi:hypothetical protein VPHF99_0048 [Vibrio phage F99]
MFGKVCLNYGGVVITENGLDVVTEDCEMSTNDGVQFDIEEDKVEQVKNLSYMVEFLQDVFFNQPYVEPVQVGTRGDLSDVIFEINEKYFLHVLMETNGNIYPVLLRPSGEGCSPVKFSYEGEVMDQFFSEVRKDVLEVLS